MAAIDGAKIIRAFQKDGWQLTFKPYIMRMDNHIVIADAGFRHDTEEMLVLMKSFEDGDDIEILFHAIGQYLVYKIILEKQQPDTKIFIAMPHEQFEGLISAPAVAMVFEEREMRFALVDMEAEEIVGWV